jgi:hypothetical protein
MLSQQQVQCLDVHLAGSALTVIKNPAYNPDFAVPTICIPDKEGVNQEGFNNNGFRIRNKWLAQQNASSGQRALHRTRETAK